MSTKKGFVNVSNLEVKTVKKDIKNIHIGVYPPSGSVRVAAPMKTTNEALKLLVISKIPWIKKQQSKFIKQERQTKREYISGESHYFLGNRYLLDVIYSNSKPKIEIKRSIHLALHIKKGTATEKRGEIINDFYRAELRKYIPLYIEKWQKNTGIHVNEFRIRKMKTKWGSCNPEYKRIWVNLELAKKPLHCLEYIIVHEMIHFLEEKHSNKFNELMNSFMPKWQQYKKELNNSILGYNKWNL